MTENTPDAVKVAAKVAEQICEGVALFEAERRRIHQAAEAGACAMQDAMAGRVRVKALEWAEEVQDLWWSADTYRIEAFDGGGFATRVATPQSQGFRTIAHGVTFEKAQAVAQADYERRILSALEPAGAQEVAASPIAAMAATLQAVAEEGVFVPDPLTAPDVPGLVERLRSRAARPPSSYKTTFDITEAADALEALQAEVARLTEEADGDFVAAAVRVMREHPGFDARDYEFDGISADDFEQFFSEDMKEAWRCAEAAEARATAAEAERDALKAEVERLRIALGGAG